jgi:hypothetical protein
MPKIQVFVSNPVLEQINDIVNEKRTEGADRSEANVSNTSSMLIELGLRVYKLQRNKTESGFSQLEFNKVMLENMMKTSFISQMLLGMNSYNQEIVGDNRFIYKDMAAKIKNDAATVMERFFPEIDDNEG